MKIVGLLPNAGGQTELVVECREDEWLAMFPKTVQLDVSIAERPPWASASHTDAAGTVRPLPVWPEHPGAKR